jgi:hypothetical protein
MRWLLGCAILLASALALFAVPARLEGPVLVPISPGHGLALLDMLALVPLMSGTALLVAGLWRRRQRLSAFLAQSPGLAGAGSSIAGLVLGLLLASVFPFFWWWAIGAGLLTATLVAAALLAAMTSPTESSTKLAGAADRKA